MGPSPLASKVHQQLGKHPQQERLYAKPGNNVVSSGSGVRLKLVPNPNFNTIIAMNEKIESNRPHSQLCRRRTPAE